MNNSTLPDDLTTMGDTNIKISPLGIGTWAWGDRIFWGYGKNYNSRDLKETFGFFLDSGINFFDTAEVYGMGNSEKYLGQFSKGKRDSIVIATKFFPFPWRVYPASLNRALRKSLSRLQTNYADIYQIHMPVPPYPVEFWLKKLAGAYHSGSTKAVGVSNYDLNLTKRAYKFLTERGIPLASNQLKYSLLDRQIEKSGLLDYCLMNNITVVSYSPLEMGMLTGKYTAKNPPTGIRRYSYRYTPAFLGSITPLLALMREVGQGHDNRTPAQVAINWAIQKGTVPIPGAKNIRQARENIGAMSWCLTDDEVQALDAESDKIHST